MNILLDHKEIKRFSNTKNKVNVLGCIEIDEVQDNVLLLKTKENSFLKEQVGNWRGKPVVKFNILVENVLHKDVLFVVEQNAETVLDFDALGINNRPVITSVITENRIINDITPQLVTEHAKQAIVDTVKQGKQHLSRVVKEAANTANKQFKQNIDSIIGDAIGELDVLREDILTDIAKQNKLLYSNNLHKLTTTYADDTDSIIANGILKIEKVIDSKTHTFSEIYETRANSIVKTNLDRVEKSVSKVAALQESKQLNLENIKNIVEEAKAYTTNTEKLLKEYTATAKRDLEHVRMQVNRVAESGGGTNAVQYANGGTMVGDLHVTGSITGHISLSSLNQDGARIGDSVIWNGVNWVATTTKVVSAIGDSVLKEFIITHNFNTFDVMVQVYDNLTNAVVYPSIQGNSLNDTKIEFSIIPSINNYRVIIKQ